MSELSGEHKRASHARWAVVAGVVVALLLVYIAATPLLSSLATRKVRSTLQNRFGGELSVKNLRVSVFPRLAVSGDSLMIRRSAGAEEPPLITVARFKAEGNFLGVWFRRVSHVQLEGLEIHLPPKESTPEKTPQRKRKVPYIAFGEIVADGATVSTMPRDPRKNPLVFNIKKLRMHG